MSSLANTVSLNCELKTLVKMSLRGGDYTLFTSLSSLGQNAPPPSYDEVLAAGPSLFVRGSSRPLPFSITPPPTTMPTVMERQEVRRPQGQCVEGVLNNVDIAVEFCKAIFILLYSVGTSNK